jgi:hypothetical protein
MTIAENIYRRSLRLPEDVAREALDFVTFLEARYAKQNQAPWKITVARFAGALSDDFPDDIDDTDLGQDSHREPLE